MSTDLPGDETAAAEEAALARREAALVARIESSKARIEHLSGLIQWMEARWPFLEGEERRRDPAAPEDTIGARVRARIEAELAERDIDPPGDPGPGPEPA